MTHSRSKLAALWGLLSLACFALLSACGAGQYEPRKPSGPEELGASAPVDQFEVPRDSKVYTTSTGANGVRGGDNARTAERLLQDELAERGDKAEPDGALASAATWLLHTAYNGEDHTSDATAITAAVQRFGFAGLMLGGVAGSVGAERTAASLREILSQVPKNTPINRYGIAAGRGQDIAIVFGLIDAVFDDFPRSVAPGGTLRLKGSIAARFERAGVFTTNPAGKTDEQPLNGRDLDTTLSFPSAGVYKLEVLGYGATGPVVIVNVPIEVGATARRSVASGAAADPNLTLEQAEATLLSLLNAERTERGLGALEPDAELRTVALAHSTDMTDHHFFGHVSPTTGTPEDRVRAAHLRVSKFGECVALESTPAGAHRALMDSPAHRSAMLDPSFTHVGIGVSFVNTNGQRRLDATLLFGRRPPAEDSRLSAEDALAAIQATRGARNLPALRVDPVLSAAARAGSLALANGSAKDAPQVLAAVGNEMQRQVNRTHTSRASCQLYLEIIDREQLAEIPLLKRADIVAVGLGTAPLADDSGPKLGVVLLGDAGAGKPVDCK